jgi:dienelactone hydrolase
MAIAPMSFFAGPPDDESEVVSFQSKPIPLSPFKVRRARAKGIELKPKPGPEVSAVLARPKLIGRRPAVVVLVSGDGLQDSHLSWGAKLAQWGYASIVIDSFGSRGAKDFRDGIGPDMKADADATHTYLSGLDFVDSDRMALVGFSLGGTALLTLFTDQDMASGNEAMYKAGVAIYPTCGSTAAVS